MCCLRTSFTPDGWVRICSVILRQPSPLVVILKGGKAAFIALKECVFAMNANRLHILMLSGMIKTQVHDSSATNQPRTQHWIFMSHPTSAHSQNWRLCIVMRKTSTLYLQDLQNSHQSSLRDRWDGRVGYGARLRSRDQQWSHLNTISWSRKWRGFESHSHHYSSAHLSGSRELSFFSYCGAWKKSRYCSSWGAPTMPTR